MKNSNENIDDIDIKSHEDIIRLINDIRLFEENFEEFEFFKSQEIDTDDIIEVDHNVKNNDLIKQEQDLIDKKKSIPFFNTGNPATFKIRYNEKGDLVNLDLRKTPPKKDQTKKRFNIKNILPLHKSKEKKEKKSSEDKDDKDKKSKIKNTFSKFSKLKNVIPNKGKKENKKE